MFRQDGRGKAAASGAGGGASAGTPGKRTLTDRMHGAAAAGTSGGGGGLPHEQVIQRAFGRHDVSQVAAHTGGAARDAAADMGAQAFAYGDHVAFAGSPDLFTAAHEAAHVVQQRGGLHLPGGVGAAGDASERHADAVAERVVQGQSVEELLDGVAGADARAPASPVVQHRLTNMKGVEHYYADHRGHGQAFVRQGGGWYICTHNDQRYEHLTATDQFRDANGLFMDPERWRVLAATGDGYYTDGATAFAYVGDRYIPRLQLGAVAATAAATPAVASTSPAPAKPDTVASSPAPAKPMVVDSPLKPPAAAAAADADADADGAAGADGGALASPPSSPPPMFTRRASHSEPGKKGKSTHFPNKLPPRETGAAAVRDYAGGSKAKFKRIMPKTERSGLPDSLTKALVAETVSSMAAGQPVTAEAAAMAASGATLSGTGTQRNHTQAVENANRFYAGVVAKLTDHGATPAARAEARDDAEKVARTLSKDEAVVKKVRKIVDDMDSDEDSDGAAESASAMGRMSADHRNNVGFGHGGKNMGMSNRPDVATSPNRTHIADRDADILDELEDPFVRQLGPKLGTKLVTVPTSPGGQHYMSSKTLQAPASGSAAAASPAAASPAAAAPKKKPGDGDGGPPAAGTY